MRELTATERAFIERMPKAELHVHLEGSVRPRTLLELGRAHGVSYPFDDAAGAVEWFRFRDFPHFIEIFMAILESLLTEEDHERVAYELAETAHRDNTRYLEVIISPSGLLNPRSSAHPDVVLAGCRKAARRALDDFGVRMQFTVDAVRVRPVDEVMATVRWAVENQGDGLVGLNLGGTEVGYPASLHAEAIRIAKDNGLAITLHAGETVGPESVWDALKCGADRIGHGVRAVEDPALVRHLVEREIVLEVSPTSNVCLGVAPSVALHQFRALHDAGVLVTINSDDPPMFNCTLGSEYLALAEQQGFTLDELAEISLRAARAAFLPDAEKATLVARFEDELGRLHAELLADATA
jgi:aminodeoxyfutalosine deaminase